MVEVDEVEDVEVVDVEVVVSVHTANGSTPTQVHAPFGL